MSLRYSVVLQGLYQESGNYFLEKITHSVAVSVLVGQQNILLVEC